LPLQSTDWFSCVAICMAAVCVENISMQGASPRGTRALPTPSLPRARRTRVVRWTPTPPFRATPAPVDGPRRHRHRGDRRGRQNPAGGGRCRPTRFFALHETGCAEPSSAGRRAISPPGGRRARGAMPLYAKMHSYGEYVFDRAWADAAAGMATATIRSSWRRSRSSGTGAPAVRRQRRGARRTALAALAIAPARGECVVLVLACPVSWPRGRACEQAGMLSHGVSSAGRSRATATSRLPRTFNHDKRKVKRERRVANAGVRSRAGRRRDHRRRLGILLPATRTRIATIARHLT
jgi:hypothetical protein